MFNPCTQMVNMFEFTPEKDLIRFFLQFKQRLRDIMTQNWCADINNASRCCTYVNFKTLLNPEKYLSIAIPFNLKS